jgi:hypothetical protein
MGYYDPETDETPEERRMRLLAEMGSPFLGNRRDADLGTIDSGGVFGMGPQGFQVQPDTLGLGAAWLDPGQRVPGSYRDPGSDYVDPPPRLGNLFAKPGEPPAPEHDGLLYNGTRSPAGRGVLARETPAVAIPEGPIASPADINVEGANNQDRTNAPRPADAPKTAAPISLPSLAGGLGTGLAANYASMAPQNAGPGTRMGATPAAAEADESDSAPASGTPASPIPQPQVAAVADGLSRKPGSPAAMTWLQDNADLFIALGAGLLSGRNIGSGIIEGLRLANEQKTTSAKQKLEAEKNQAEQLKKASHAAVLQKAFGMTPDMAIASADDADLVKRAQQQVFPDPKDPAWQRTTLPNGQVILQNKETGDQKAAPGEDAGAERPLTDPAERAKWGIQPDDKKAYTIRGNEAPKVIGGSGQTINVNTGQDKLVEIAADQFKAHLAAVDQARQTLQATASMRDQLNAPGGVITGAAAGDRLALQKIGSLLGVADPSAITNTEALRAAAGPLVLATVKGLGAGTSISNSDRDFAAEMAGGNIALNESSIRRMIDIQEQAAREKMTRSQRVINQLIQTNPNLANLAPLLTAPPPEARPPAASQSAPPAPVAPNRPAQRRIRVDAQGNEIR